MCVKITNGQKGQKEKSKIEYFKTIGVIFICNITNQETPIYILLFKIYENVRFS